MIGFGCVCCFVAGLFAVFVVFCFLINLYFFEQVAVARMQRTNQVYALKIMNKWNLLRRGEVLL